MDSGINVRQLADIIYPKVTYFNLISPSISFFFLLELKPHSQMIFPGERLIKNVVQEKCVSKKLTHFTIIVIHHTYGKQCKMYGKYGVSIVECNETVTDSVCFLAP